MNRTKTEMLDELRETKQFNLRMEIALADLRRRNADLANALNEVDPSAFDRITPEKSTYTRFNRISKLVDAAVRFHAEVNSEDPGRKTWIDGYQYESESFLSAVEDVNNYYRDHFDSKKQLTPEHIAKMQAGREKWAENA